MEAAHVTHEPLRSLAWARLESLCDPDSFRPLRSAVRSNRTGDALGDGVVSGVGEAGGQQILCYAEDPAYMGGSLGEQHARSIVEAMELAGRSGVPIVGFVESGGARLQEGHAALEGYGRIFRASVDLAGRVPQISVVTGVSAGGGAYSPALTDFVVMSDSARMFLTGPRVVQEALGEDVSMEELGGPDVHGRNGVCQLVEPTEEAAIASARRLLELLPSSIGSPLRAAEPRLPVRLRPDSTVPLEPRRVYDVRDVIAGLADAGSELELYERWARSMVTALARIDGRPVGIVANQPRRLGGVIDSEAAEKASRFIDTCDRFGLPLVVLVDTPGFMPGSRQERAGVIRYGAGLLRSFAAARVPKLTVVLRKAYGGAVITMNSKGLGADLVYAWPEAEIGIMAAGQAVGVVHRRRLAAAGGEASQLRDELGRAYADDHLTAEAAAASGFVDEVIEPGETRERLAQALRLLGDPR
jgi:acetyl-CoA carboxylase carboxyltransferase component